jgi:putative addiction module killer protein
LTDCLLWRTIFVIEIRQTRIFASWLVALRDKQALTRINARIRRLSLGNPGDVKPVGSGVWEMRIDYGPGYRAYYVRRENTVYVLLCGGDKRSQDQDIIRAIELSREF